MNFGFEQPGFLYAMSALAVLLALYVWYRRSRRKPVAALFLWDRPETSPQSGSRFELKKLPLSFYLEALVVLLLAGAAAMPFLRSRDSYPPLAVIVDNSFSMQSAWPGEISPRKAGEAYAAEQLKSTPGRRVIGISAGVAPRLIADGREQFDFKAFGAADEPGADLTAAIAMARGISAFAEILVITDHAPDFPLTDDISWFSAATAKPNTALVNVRRQDEKILVEVMNFSDVPVKVQLRLTPGGTGEWLELKPQERRKIVSRLPVEARKLPVEVLLEVENDALMFDNRAYLLPEEKAPVVCRVAAELPEAARKVLESAFKDSPDFTLSGEPELLFDIPRPGVSVKYHRFIWHGADSDRAVLSNQTLSVLSGQELTRGLPLQDLRWSAVPDLELPGRLLIQRGDTALMSVVSKPRNTVDIHFNMMPAHSNLPQRPFWPILFWNLADVLRGERPGPERANYRSGEIIHIRLPDQAPPYLKIKQPDGSEWQADAVRRMVFLPAGAPGIYQIDGRWSVAVSALDGNESDLRGQSPYTRTASKLPDEAEFPRRSLIFVLLLAAVAVLMFHQYKVGSARRDV